MKRYEEICAKLKERCDALKRTKPILADFLRKVATGRIKQTSRVQDAPRKYPGLKKKRQGISLRHANAGCLMPPPKEKNQNSKAVEEI